MCKRMSTLLLLLAYCIVQNGSLTCEDPWIPSCGSCYMWGNNTMLTWNDARDNCSGEGGLLLKVDDEEEKQCIMPLLDAALDSERVWIGGGRSEERDEAIGFMAKAAVAESM